MRYTLVCTKVGLPDILCDVAYFSFVILGGCALLVLCGMMPSYISVRIQGLL